MTNPTDAINVIGDEILSGRTKDKNIGWLAEQLNAQGIQLREARVIADVREVIIDTVRTMSATVDLVFTSGGTEANNLALSMFDTIITSAVEHDSVMQAAPDAKRIPVDSEGRVDLAALGEMLASLDDAARPRTLVSVMTCLLYTSPSPRDLSTARMPSSA